MGSDISVHIVTFNSAKDIEACLTAVSKQSYPIHELVIIDNHSTDNTVKCIEKWHRAYSYHRLKVVENSNNIGFAAAHNQAIRLTNTNYCLILNPDVELTPNYIKNTIGVLKNDETLGSVTGKLYRDLKNEIIDSTGIVIKKNRRSFDRGAGEKDVGQWEKLTDIFGASGAAAIYNRKMINDIMVSGQFFDEDFFAYKEDIDVAWRAQIRGWRAKFVPEAIAIHQRGWKDEKKRKEIPLFIRHHSYINRYYMIIKNDKAFFLFLHGPIIIFYELMSFIYAIIIERELLAAWSRAIRIFPSMYLKRKFIQSKQLKSTKEIYRFFKGLW
ncbi:glycosyltransferase family 2 protein [Metabacillus halosaccharovorans]|uniref:glycosyltransferase family 2 protein n=1 Tax=Metabacillus halosaccharovorans TaxID=930124 RepID=UPI0034CF938D